MYGCGKDCLILIPFRLPQITCFTLSLKCFSSDSDNCPNMEIRPLLQFPHLAGTVVQSYYSTVFPPISFILPSCVWFYIFFLAGQVLLSTFTWCSACTSVSERDVLHIHLLLHHLVPPANPLVYEPLNILLNLVYYHVFENCCIYVNQ